MSRPITYLKKIQIALTELEEPLDPPVVPFIDEILSCKHSESATILAMEGFTSDCCNLKCNYAEFVNNGNETPHFKIVSKLSPGKYESCERYAERLKQESHVLWPTMNSIQYTGLINTLDTLTEPQMKLITQYVRCYKQLLRVVTF